MIRTTLVLVSAFLFLSSAHADDLTKNYGCILLGVQMAKSAIKQREFIASSTFPSLVIRSLVNRRAMEETQTERANLERAMSERKCARTDLLFGRDLFATIGGKSVPGEYFSVPSDTP